MPLRAVLVAMVLATSVACSSSSGSEGPASTAPTPTPPESTVAAEPVPVEDAQAYIDALRTGLAAGDEAQGELVVPEPGATCFAERWVAIVTPDGFGSAGVTSEALTDPAFDFRTAGLSVEQATESVAAFGACEVDVSASVLTTLTTGMDEAAAACVADNLDPELLEDLLVSAFSPDADNQAAFAALSSDLTEACPLN